MFMPLISDLVLILLGKFWPKFLFSGRSNNKTFLRIGVSVFKFDNLIPRIFSFPYDVTYCAVNSV